MSRFHRIDGLPVGSLVIERYTYEASSGKKGVQWLAQVVDKDGDLALVRTCRTRREALASWAKDSHPGSDA